jgi:hypothetical protein
MGTTLTGTTPQDTYDSLIKVTNNGPLSSTARYLSDGLGNDSVLALSTAQVGIGTSTTSARLGVDNALNVGVQSLSSDPSAASVFLSNTGTSVGLAIATTNANVSYLQGRQKTGTGNAFDIALNPLGGNVGIGTTSPSTKFVVSNGGAAGLEIEPTGLLQSYNRSTGVYQSINLDGSNILFRPSGTERARITSDGLTFNGDTAAANALDDYEEGTWTIGVSFGGGSTGVTYSINTGSYTKIGRKVTVTGYVVLTSKGTDTGVARITGLPFTIAGATGNFSAPTLYLQNITFANAFQGFGVNGATTIAIYEVTEAGAVSTISNNDFSDTSEIILSFTYFV